MNTASAAKRMSRKRYEAFIKYLGTQQWQTIRHRVIKRAAGRCEQCGTEFTFTGASPHVHHLTYERAGRERDEDLLVLCRPCHGLSHRRTPVDLDPELLDRDRLPNNLDVFDRAWLEHMRQQRNAEETA